MVALATLVSHVDENHVRHPKTPRARILKARKLSWYCAHMTAKPVHLGLVHQDGTLACTSVLVPFLAAHGSTDDAQLAFESLQGLSNAQLTLQLGQLSQKHCVLEAELLFYLGEFDRRRLYREHACPSLFEYLMLRLGQTEDVAYKWKWGARLARQYPLVLELLATGRLSLSALMLLKPHLTEENHVDWLLAAAGKSKREVEKLVATRCPKADVPTRIRKLPTRVSGRSVEESSGVSLYPATEPSTCTQLSSSVPAPSSAPAPTSAPAPSVDRPCPDYEFKLSHESRPDRGKDTLRTTKIQPLSATTYRVVFTASERLKQKMARAGELLSHAISPGDLPALFERALDGLIETEQRRRYGSSRAPRTQPSTIKDALIEGVALETGRGALETPLETAANLDEDLLAAIASRNSRHVPIAVRRQVELRDGGQCTYVDAQGSRCQCRQFLQFDHRQAYANGGAPTVDNIRMLCSAHNALAAEQVFGASNIANAVSQARQKRVRQARHRPSV